MITVCPSTDPRSIKPFCTRESRIQKSLISLEIRFATHKFLAFPFLLESEAVFFPRVLILLFAVVGECAAKPTQLKLAPFYLTPQFTYFSLVGKLRQTLGINNRLCTKMTAADVSVYDPLLVHRDRHSQGKVVIKSFNECLVLN